MEKNKNKGTDLVPGSYLFEILTLIAKESKIAKENEEFLKLTNGLVVRKDAFLIERSLLKESKALCYEINIFFGSRSNTVNNIKSQGGGYLQIRRLILSNSKPYSKEEYDRYVNNPTELELNSPQPDETLCSVHPSYRNTIIKYWWYIKQLKIDDMTCKEFNQKYKNYIKEDFTGLEIENQEIINWLDDKFQEFIKTPDFQFSQIKTKFGNGRFYCEGLSNEQVVEVENYITNVINKTNE